jgi:Tol biopolymer transport system component
MDTVTRNIDRVTESEERETSPAFSADGDEIIYSQLAGGTGSVRARLMLTRLNDNSTMRITDYGSTYDTGAAFFAEGQKIVFARSVTTRPRSTGGNVRDDWDIYVIDRAGGEVRKQTDQRYQQMSSPRVVNGTRVAIYSAVVRRPNGNVNSTAFRVSLGANGAPEELLLGDCKDPRCFAFALDPYASRTGETCAFISDRAHRYRYDVYVADLATLKAKGLNVVARYRLNRSPVVPTDGSTIYYLSQTGKDAAHPQYALWKVDVAGGKAMRLIDGDVLAVGGNK